jgi:hypothetical protein
MTDKMHEELPLSDVEDSPEMDRAAELASLQQLPKYYAEYLAKGDIEAAESCLKEIARLKAKYPNGS